jgi:cohesin complex subunit SA-1/2
VTSLHREGILVAATPLDNPQDPAGAPPNIAFLEILTEFTNKLLKQDKKVGVLSIVFPSFRVFSPM